MSTGIRKFMYSYRFRIYPTPTQQTLLAKHFGSTRYLYNHFLTKRKQEYLNSKKSLNYYDNAKKLTEMKKDLDWLKEVGSQSLQFSLKCLDSAYNRFFKGLAKFPKYKSRKAKQSFRIPQSIKLNDNYLYIPKFKEGIRVIKHREIEGTIKFATISKNKSNQYFVSITVEREIKPLKKVKQEIGIDLGIKPLATLSDGTEYKNIRTYKKYKRKIKILQRRHIKKQKGSQTRERARLAIAKKFQKLTDVRNDYLHKMTRKIVNENQVIYLEDLTVQNMMKNHKLAGAIQDCCWYEINRQLEYKAKWYGREIVRLNRWFPSSKTCCNCGWINQYLTLKDRTWKCLGCNEIVDRDLNAARMILKQGKIDNKLPMERREVKRMDSEETRIEISIG